jgi:hypothetical protein
LALATTEISSSETTDRAAMASITFRVAPFDLPLLLNVITLRVLVLWFIMLAFLVNQWFS